MTLSEMVTSITEELNLDSSNAKTMRQFYVWANSIYRSVVYAEEYPWRKRDVPILTAAYGTGTAPFVNGTDTHGPTTTQAGLDDGKCDYNFLVLDDYDTIYELENVALLGGQAIIELQEDFVHDTGTYDFSVYKPRYRLTGIREDWVIAVYDNTNDAPLRRVYPNHSLSYIQQGIRNPSAPQFFFMEGATEPSGTVGRDAILNLSPAPDGVYELTVKTLLGVSKLTESSNELIIPEQYAEDVMTYGIGMLYNLKQKDEEGIKYYGGMFDKVLQSMVHAAGKEPGRTKRIRGYAARDAGVRDPDVPKDWDPGF